MDTDPIGRAYGQVCAAVVQIQNNQMPPWFYAKQNVEEWVRGLDQVGASRASGQVIKAMIDAKKQGLHNSAATLMNLFVALN